jgi:hypothetical protein
MAINIEVTLNVITCYCGALYAVPHWAQASYYSCPFCGYREEEKLRREMRELRTKISHQSYVINGLRGALRRR